MPTLNIIIGLSHSIFGILVSLEQSQAVWVGLLWSQVVFGGLLQSEVVLVFVASVLGYSLSIMGSLG